MYKFQRFINDAGLSENGSPQPMFFGAFKPTDEKPELFKPIQQTVETLEEVTEVIQDVERPEEATTTEEKPEEAEGVTIQVAPASEKEKVPFKIQITPKAPTKATIPEPDQPLGSLYYIFLYLSDWHLIL